MESEIHFSLPRPLARASLRSSLSLATHPLARASLRSSLGPAAHPLAPASLRSSLSLATLPLDRASLRSSLSLVTHPRARLRATLRATHPLARLSVTLFLTLFLTLSTARAALPLPTDAVRAALAPQARPTPLGLAHALIALDALDALAPATALEALDALIAAPAPSPAARLLQARARALRAARLALPPPEPPPLSLFISKTSAQDAACPFADPSACHTLTSPRPRGTWDPTLLLRQLLTPSPAHATALAAALRSAAPRLAPRDLLFALHTTSSPIDLLALAPPSVDITLAQAAAFLDADQPTRARLALIAAPDTPLARWLRARLALLDDTPEEVLRAYNFNNFHNLPSATLLAQINPLPERDQRLLIRALRALGATPTAALLSAALADALPGRLDLALDAILDARSAGHPDQALTRLDALVHAHPDHPTLVLDAVRAHAARTTPSDRAQALALALPLADRSDLPPSVALELARLLVDLDAPAPADALLARALAAHPADPDLRQALESASPPPPPPDALTYADVAETRVTDPTQPFEILSEFVHIKVHSDGRTTRWVRRILRAQAVPDRRDARTTTIRFDPTQRSVRVVDASIYRPRAGTWDRHVVRARHLVSLGEAWYGLYYDLRELQIPFDDLHTGDLIEITWVIDSIGQLTPGIADLFEVLGARFPKHLHRVTVDAPASLPLQTRLSCPDASPQAAACAAATESTTRLPDGTIRTSLVIRDLPPHPVERAAPGAAEITPIWQATSFTSWRELATWYRALIAPQRVLTPEMRALVAATTQKKNTTPSATINSLYTYVTQEIRYVGLEFGIHGIQPYATDRVWQRRFGDCKDKATLLALLLNTAGIPAELALVRTRPEGRLPGALPSLALFDHAAVYLPDRALLIDPTPLHYGIATLPPQDQAAQILVLAPSDAPADLQLAPLDGPSRNGMTGTWVATLNPSGDAAIQGTTTFFGTQAPTYRALLLDPTLQGQRLTEWMNRPFPGLTLDSFHISPPAAVDRPFELTFHARAPRLAIPRDSTLTIERPIGLGGQREQFASDSNRLLPRILGVPQTFTSTWRYLLPPGYQVATLPTDADADTPWGAYTIRWGQSEGLVHVTTTLFYRADQVPAADYPAFREFVRTFDALATRPLVLTSSPVPAAR